MALSPHFLNTNLRAALFDDCEKRGLVTDNLMGRDFFHLCPVRTPEDLLHKSDRLALASSHRPERVLQDWHQERCHFCCSHSQGMGPCFSSLLCVSMGEGLHNLRMRSLSMGATGK